MAWVGPGAASLGLSGAVDNLPTTRSTGRPTRRRVTARHGQAAGHGAGHRRPQVSGRTRGAGSGRGQLRHHGCQAGRHACDHLCPDLTENGSGARPCRLSRIDPELRLQAEGRTLAVHRRGGEPVAPSTRTRDRRLEIRTTAEERELIDRAAGTTGTDLTSFVVSHLVDAARRVLADRDRFVLAADAAAEWEKVNRRPAEEFAGLRRLMQRPSPFAE